MSRFSIQWEIHSLQKAPSYIFAFKLQGALSTVVPVLSLSLYVDSSYRHCRSHFVQEPRDLSTRHHNSFHYAYIMNINHEPFGLGGRNSRIAHLSLSLSYKRDHPQIDIVSKQPVHSYARTTLYFYVFSCYLCRKKK